MSSVSRDAAVGTITLELILFFLPSIARVLLKPIRPILAALKLKSSLRKQTNFILFYVFKKKKKKLNLPVICLTKITENASI